MAIEIGTSTGMKDLLSKLRTFVIANNWVSEAYTTDVDVEIGDELYLRGPGSTDSENVHINIRTEGDVLNDLYGWQIFGATSYDNAQPMTSQPGSSPANNYMICTDNAKDYWFYVNDRRIIVIIKENVRYFGAYMGFILPWGTPLDYPFPLYVCGNSTELRFTTNTGSRDRMFWDPGISPSGTFSYAALRLPDGSWNGVLNHAGNTSDDSFSYSSSHPWVTHPYGMRSISNNDNFFTDNEIRPLETVPNSGFMCPVWFCPVSYNSYLFPGMLDDVYFVNGFGSTAEETFSFGNEKATGTLTLTGNAVNSETVTIGKELDAASILSASAQVSNADTVTLDAKTYTFQTTLTNVDGNVHIGATARDSLLNLFNAVNLGAGAGTDYATAMTLHPTVEALDNGGASIEIKAKTAGTGGNTIATTETSTSLSFPDTTLDGGTDARVYTFVTSLSAGPNVADEVLVGATASDSIDNLVQAINKGTDIGILYSFGTTANTEITAAAGAGDTMDVASLVSGTVSNQIVTTETMTNGSWGGALLTGGGGSQTYRKFINIFRTNDQHWAAIREA